MVSVSSLLHFKSVGNKSVFVEMLIRKYLPVLMYGFDDVSLDSNSIKLITQAWNSAF